MSTELIIAIVTTSSSLFISMFTLMRSSRKEKVDRMDKRINGIIDQLEKELETARERYAILQKEHNLLLKDYNKNIVENTKLQQKIIAYETRINNLEETISSLQEKIRILQNKQ